MENIFTLIGIGTVVWLIAKAVIWCMDWWSIMTTGLRRNHETDM